MTQTVTEFMQTNAIIRVSCEQVESRPDGRWPHSGRHYHHVFGREDKTFEIYVSHGPKVGEPTGPAETFDMAIMDARNGQYDPFDFIEEFGYENMTEARRAWEGCRKARRSLREFLGNRLFERAMRVVEEE